MGKVLYRDPVYDGATDPVVIFNGHEQTWWMLYTSRRATAPGPDVGWVHGSRIGIASLLADGESWLYRGTLDLEHEPGHNTFWAPEIVWQDGMYHMYVSYIRGVPERWAGHQRHIVHYTSEDLLMWAHRGPLTLSSDFVIDACVCERPDGGYRLWYKDEADMASTWAVESDDLWTWGPPHQVVRTPGGHEGPNVFKFRGFYWLIVDTWTGQAVFRSADQMRWEGAGVILDASDGDAPGEGLDVGPGHHADVLVTGERAFIVYFTHPWRYAPETSDLDRRRSVIMVAELEETDGVLRCLRHEDRDWGLALPEAVAHPLVTTHDPRRDRYEESLQYDDHHD